MSIDGGWLWVDILGMGFSFAFSSVFFVDGCFHEEGGLCGVEEICSHNKRKRG